jgi:hypothetical protein
MVVLKEVNLIIVITQDIILCLNLLTLPFAENNTSGHTGSSFNVLNLGLGAVCAVSAGKVKVAGPAQDDFVDTARLPSVTERTSAADRGRTALTPGFLCARLIKRVERDYDWSASAYKYDGGHLDSSTWTSCLLSLAQPFFIGLTTFNGSSASSTLSYGVLVCSVWQLRLFARCNKVIFW